MSGRAPTRGTGRGGRRGKASATSDPPDTAPANASATLNSDSNSQSTLEASPPPSQKITTPQHLLNDESGPSPNSSPASIPTETPAPTPARAIPRSEPTGPSVPASGRGGRGGTRGARGAPKAAAPSRFKPKIVRSDANKLQELADKEAARLAGISAARAREEAKLMRGRGRGARGRGDVMGRGLGRGVGAGATGIFGALPESIPKNPGFASRSGGGGGSGSGGGSGGTKREGFSSSGGGSGGSGGRSNKDHDYIPQYPNDDGEVERVNIEEINDVVDDDVIITGSRYIGQGNRKAVSSRGGLKPIRLDRHEHVERTTIVNTETIKTEPILKKEPAAEGEDDMIEVDELLSSKPNTTPKKEGRNTRIKEENESVSFGDRSGTPPLSERPLHEIPSPDAKKGKAPASQAKSAESQVKSKKDRLARKLAKKALERPVIQTEEDKAEYERHLHDVDVLAHELGGMQGNLGGVDAEGDIAMDGEEVVDKKEGRLYLFQFPPILPVLYDPVKGKPEKYQKKEEVIDVEMPGSPTATKGKGKVKDRIDLTGEPTAVKIEDAEYANAYSKKDESSRGNYVSEEGWIGKLVVRESGRVELCWGGTNLVVGRGVDSDFLTTGMVVDLVETGPPGGGVPEGKALSMGQIMGKFVVTPDWQRLT